MLHESHLERGRKMTVNQISVFVENRSGALAQLTRELSDAGVNLRAFSIAETTDFGVLRFIADDEAKAAEALKKEGRIFSLTPVLAVVIKDEPGSLADTLSILAAGGIDVEYTYAFLTPREGTACMIFRVADNDRAAELLMNDGVVLAKKEEML